ncbi:MAG TPA: response regulator [Methylomusa anaerophila]|uniref:Chemotaxis protein CheY n=1 Tax=Methylomusa anaerophila TaxID=1930071 RepID=A0A348AMR5_9FIRM|nr:response regulator [Methylomusa anaerophila]BBB92363.1 chemotaxis protein CheY [Methylomusa anaerophila]HML89998.1 response regulator [Methylomusa anaerophila]
MAAKILICDDSMLVRKKLRDILEQWDCEVFEAKNGLEGVDFYQVHKPETVLMDIVMPELDGLESLKRIKEYDPNARVIMLSSSGTSAKLIEALKCGAADFIQKPYTKEQIAKAIGR